MAEYCYCGCNPSPWVWTRDSCCQ